MRARIVVVEAVRETAGLRAGEIALGARLKEDLGVDSLDFVRLIQLVEEGLGITISDEAAAVAETVGDLVVLSEAALLAPS